MAKYRNVSTGIIYEPPAELDEQYSNSERFEAVEEPAEVKAPRRRATKAKSE